MTTTHKTPKIPPTNAKLRELMKSRNLTAGQVADLIGISVHAVHSYTRTPGDGFRVMPRPYLELLAGKLGLKLAIGPRGGLAIVEAA